MLLHYRTIYTPGEDYMVSFDVVSLLTKVTVDLATRVVQQRLTADPSPDDAVTLLKFSLAIDAMYLAYRGEVYQHVYSTAMGSPVSVTMANLVMEDVEQRTFMVLPTG